jgi:hypothetical protein
MCGWKPKKIPYRMRGVNAVFPPGKGGRPASGRPALPPQYPEGPPHPTVVLTSASGSGEDGARNMREGGFAAGRLPAVTGERSLRAKRPLRRGRAVCRAAAGLLALAGLLRAQPSPDLFVPVEAAPPEKVELGTPKAINDGGTIAGSCTVHYIRSKSGGGDAVPADRREHSEGLVPGLGPGYVISEIYVVQQGVARVIRLPNTQGGDPDVVALNNRGQLLVSRSIQGGALFFLGDVDSGRLQPIGLVATVDEDGTPRTVRLKYLTGLNDRGEVYGVYDGPPGHCAVVGTPSLAASDTDPAPQAPTPYRFLGCAGKGALHIAAVNAKGQMTGVAEGHLGFLWTDGKLTTFVFPGSTFTTPERITEAGLVTGSFRPFNDVQDDGLVANHKGNIGLTSPEKSFVYDGAQFRLLSVPSPGNGSTTLVRAISASGTLLGTTNARLGAGGPGTHPLFQAFTVSVAALPVVRTQPSSGDYTSEAVARWQAAAHSPGDTGRFDEAYAVLKRDVGPEAALALRAFQLLHSEGPVARPGKVTLNDSVGNLYNRSLNDYLHDAQGGVAALLLNLLAQAQQTPEGASAVVEVFGAIVGSAHLDDLQTAGSLTDRMLPNEAPADRKARMTARGKLVRDLDEQLAAHPDPLTSALSPDRLASWQLPEAPADTLAELRETVNLVQAQFGAPAAATFLACEILRREKSFSNPEEADMRTRQIHAGLDGTMGATDLLFGLQAMSALKDLKAQGKAEDALRTFARVPAPAPCPGLDRIAKGLSPPQSDHLVDRTEVSGADGDNLLNALTSLEGQALKPFSVSRK